MIAIYTILLILISSITINQGYNLQSSRRIVSNIPRPKHFTTNVAASTNSNEYINKINYIGGSSWDQLPISLDKTNRYGCKIIGTLSTELPYMDDGMCPVIDDNQQKKERKPHFNLNVGRALEGLRRELPVFFVAHDLDYSIFANQITIIDEGQRKMEVSKYVYQGAIKTVRMASAFSSIYPSMNVRKIEYIEDCQSIQCLVDVVLPDAIRVDGKSVWEGMFYFGLNDDGLISSHVFDRKISKKTPMPADARQYPWIVAANAKWDAELIAAAPF